MFFNILFFIINVSILVFGYFFLKEKIEKKLINREVLDNIKKEVNSLIIQLNKTTLDNINLLEEKLKDIDKKIILVDRKKSGLKLNLSRFDKKEKLIDDYKDLFAEVKNNTYSPKKIVKQSMKNTENLYNQDTSLKKKTIDDEIKEMTDFQKADYLLNKGWKLKEVQKKVGLSSGELELLISTQRIRQ